MTLTYLGAVEADWLCEQVLVSGGTVTWSAAGLCFDPEAEANELVLTEPVPRGNTLLVLAVYSVAGWGAFGSGARVEDTQGNEWHVDADNSPYVWSGLGGARQHAVKVYRCNVTTPLLPGDTIRVKGAPVMAAWKADRKLLPYDLESSAGPSNDGSGYPPYVDRYGPTFPVAQAPVLEFGGISFLRGRDGLTATTGHPTYPLETASLLEGLAMLSFAEGTWARHDEIHSGPTPASPITFDNTYQEWWTLWPGYREIAASEVPADYRFGARYDSTGIPHGAEFPLYPFAAAVAYYRVLPQAGGVDLLQLANGWLFRARVTEGEVLAERSLDAGATWPLSVTVATDADPSAAPTLTRDELDHLWCWYHAADGTATGYLSKDLGATWDRFAEVSNRRYPRVVRQSFRSLIAAHDGTQLCFFTSPDGGDTADELPDLALTCPEQLAAVRVDRRDGVQLVIQTAAGGLEHRYLTAADAWSDPVTLAEHGTLPSYAVGVQRALLLYWDDGALRAVLTDETYGGAVLDVTPPEGFAEGYLGALMDQREVHHYAAGLDPDGAPVVQFSRDDAASWVPLA